MKKNSRDHIQTAMVSHNIILFILLCLTAFGIWSLPNMNKDEFPAFTIRQGVVAAIYPGAMAEEIEAEVTGRLEQFLFTYQDIDKELTYSITEDGVTYVFVELRKTVKDKDAVWSKIRAGLELFRKTSLPPGVLQIVVLDDFGSTSSMLLAVESPDRTPRELETFANELCDKLRTIPEMGKVKIIGKQQEEIAIEIDPDRLSAYNIDQTALMASLATQGFRTISGTMGNSAGGTMLHVTSPIQSEYEIGNQIIFFNPLDGSIIHLRDIANISRRYGNASSFVNYYENGKAPCLIIDMQMVDDNNIVAFGDKIEKILDEARNEMPADLRFHRITDQPRVVNDSVVSFLKDILLSIVVVILVMLMLFPLKTALVAGSGIPICIFITMGVMYLFDIQLHTVTLAALIVVLGMLVDNSVIVIDGYCNTLNKGYSRWYSAAISTKELFIPMVVATLSIAGMFFPMTKIITGPIGDFVQLFPWTIFIALLISIIYAVWFTPYLCVAFIKPQTKESNNIFIKIQNKFFEILQNGYERFLTFCFKVPWLTILFTFALIGLGIFLFKQGDIQMMPKADRNCFAVEIHLIDGSSINETETIADSLARIMETDPRITSITSFVGMSSPRFHATYAPQISKPSYAQFIVNTISNQATEELLNEYRSEKEHLFSNATIRYKQMDYQAVNAPVEVYFTGEDINEVAEYMEEMKNYLSSHPDLVWVHSDYDETVNNVSINLIPEESERLGITQAMLSVYLSGALGGQSVTTLWEGDYGIPVVLYKTGFDTLDYQSLGEIMIPTAYPEMWVPLRQVAKIEPQWHHSEIGHRNNLRTITLSSDLQGGISQASIQKDIDKWIAENPAPEGVKISMGGLTKVNNDLMPEIILTIASALLVMFVVLLYHFRKISISFLTLSSCILVIFGSFLGLYIFDLDLSITAILGIVSLIGVIVRNAIMMYEYAEELHFGPLKLSAKEAAFEAGKRRMRPIFLTSATTALGVIPMIMAGTALWMPMGVIICFGTIFTLPLVVTFLPVAYWKVYDKPTNKIKKNKPVITSNEQA